MKRENAKNFSVLFPLITFYVKALERNLFLFSKIKAIKLQDPVFKLRCFP